MLHKIQELHEELGMNNNNLEQLIIELFQHIEFIDGEWCIDTEQGYTIVRQELSEVLDSLESSLQDSPTIEEDEISY
jgi:hypothetical protein